MIMWISTYRTCSTFVNGYICSITRCHPSPQSTCRCRVQSSVWRLLNYWPPTPSHRTKGGGVHTRRAVRGWSVNILGDARHWIGLLLIIPLHPSRLNLFNDDFLYSLQTPPWLRKGIFIRIPKMIFYGQVWLFDCTCSRCLDPTESGLYYSSTKVKHWSITSNHISMKYLLCRL
jgi:hypothetical protein